MEVMQRGEMDVSGDLSFTRSMEYAMDALYDPEIVGPRLSLSGQHHDDLTTTGQISPRRSICENDPRPDSAIGTGSNCSDPNLDCTDFSDWTDEGSSYRTSPIRNMSESDEPEYEENLSLHSNGLINRGFDLDEHICERKILFCVECQESLCLICKARYHLEHKTTTVRNAAFQRRSQIVCLSEELAARNLLLSEQLKRCEDYRESLEINQRTVEEGLRRRRDHYRRLVDRWFTKNQDHVRAVCSYEMEKVHDNIQSISRALEEVKENVDYISQLMSYTQPTDVLALSKELLAQAECDEGLEQEVDQQIYFLFNSGKGISSSDLGEVTARYVGKDKACNQHISSGKLLMSFFTRHGRTSPYSATGLSLDPHGNIVVSDVGTDSVQVFTPTGQLVRCLDTLPCDEPSKAVTINDHTMAVVCKNDIKFFSVKDGSFGRSLQQNLDCPNSVCINNKGQMIVSDVAEDGPFVHIYDTQDWTVINTIIGGRRAPVFQNPWYVSTDSSGNVIVSDLSDHTVKIFNDRGIMVKEIGGQGAQPGRFFRPAGVCTDQCGHILVADSGNHRIQMFNAEGDFCSVLVNDESDGFMSPMDLTIDDQQRLVVLQSNGVVGTYQYLF